MFTEAVVFKTLLKKEIAENTQNHRFTIALVVCIVLIPLSFFFNQKQYLSRKTSYEESLRTYENSRKTLIELQREGAAVYRPPSPLTLLSTGVEDLLPEGVETVGFITNRGINTRDINTNSFNNPLASLYGRFDLNFIVCVVISVLSILFTFNAISGEKEKRSLSQIIAHAVPRPLVLLAKSSASTVLLALAFLTGYLAGLFILELTGYPVLADLELLLPFLMALATGILFIVVMINMGLFISTLCKNSLISMLVLIIVWSCFYMLLPKSSVILAKFIRPVTSQQVIDQEKNQLRLSMRAKLDDDVDELQRQGVFGGE